MTDLEAIGARTSRRSYAGPLPAPEQRWLEGAVARANLDAGLDARVVSDGAKVFGGVKSSYGLFAGVHALVLMAGRRDDPSVKELCGYHGERLVLEATKRGLGTCWVGGTYNGAHLQGVLPNREELAAVITIGPVKREKSLLRRAADAVRTKDSTKLYTADAEPPEWFLQGVAAAACAPSAGNHLPARFAWRGGVATVGVPSENGLALVDLGIAKLHFEVGAQGRFALGNNAPFTRQG